MLKEESKLEYIKEDKNNINKVLEKAKKIIPSMKIYKYRSGVYNNDGTNYDLQNLNGDKIRFTNVCNFNDPFECKCVDRDLISDLNNTYEENNELFKDEKINKQQLIDKYHNKFINHHHNDLTSNLLICSFSECNDNILMWSHYANSHKGFCIEYDLSKEIRRKLLILPVIYSINVPDVKDKRLENDQRFSIIYIKSLHWKYEKEWRAIAIGSELGENMSISKPTGIYLGCNIDERLEKDVLQICKDKNIKCYKAEKSSYKYKINYYEVKIN